MNKIEYSEFLAEMYKHREQHAQLLIDDKVADFSHLRSKNQSRLEWVNDGYKNEAIQTLSLDELRALVNKNHQEIFGTIGLTEIQENQLYNMTICNEPVLVNGNLNTKIFKQNKRV